MRSSVVLFFFLLSSLYCRVEMNKDWKKKEEKKKKERAASRKEEEGNSQNPCHVAEKSDLSRRREGIGKSDLNRSGQI